MRTVNFVNSLHIKEVNCHRSSRDHANLCQNPGKFDSTVVNEYQLTSLPDG
jgi:hypothetical protein